MRFSALASYYYHYHYYYYYYYYKYQLLLKRFRHPSSGETPVKSAQVPGVVLS
jgi:hypothetical protein